MNTYKTYTTRSIYVLAALFALVLITPGQASAQSRKVRSTVKPVRLTKAEMRTARSILTIRKNELLGYQKAGRYTSMPVVYRGVFTNIMSAYGKLKGRQPRLSRGETRTVKDSLILRKNELLDYQEAGRYTSMPSVHRTTFGHINSMLEKL